ncbi:MAG: type II toxin-antitoxin system PemK/MazF family toxin [Oscillatoriales cyanobacterium RU_3_3]|nr:type II toxin-antitoxin system PemK/MazF family toxin [Microcoleus sp. SU_5_3]NJL67049.1 type II toxin-antitoxin system PemK/MazF family toxin [Microcoleus sp. SM1_3_4]NJM63352.1 type II toxin-antitoxin system PemK/MazF family toxin [Oscillatoriales cyanobacterium RU_3_3]NJR21602.1 type II toxin-antitoxin system PemK/MazF family toxin [Richelia sp. CSU_2_1]
MTKGKIFLVPFPYDDLSVNKLRPAVCLTNPLGARRHVILAYITSLLPTNILETDIVLDASHPDFPASGLRVSSAIRLHQLVTVSTVVVQRELGELSSDTQVQIAEKLCNFLTQ